jgi:hypothetical protein
MNKLMLSALVVGGASLASTVAHADCVFYQEPYDCIDWGPDGIPTHITCWTVIMNCDGEDFHTPATE